MLPWLQLRPRRKNVFLAKLCVVSGLVHFFLCFGLFFMYKNYTPTATLQVHASGKQHDVIVRLLPLGVKKPTPTNVAKASIKKSDSAKALTDKKPVTQLAKVSKKSVMAKKQEVKPIEQKKPVVAEKKIEAAKEPEKKKEEKPVEKKQLVEQVTPAKQELVKDKQVEQVPLEENVQYVTHKELQGIELERAVQESVQAAWSPPVGMHEDLVSEVSVMIGWDGSLIESTIIKATNIAIYDAAVQDALEEIKFPRAAWGKEIKIAFKP